MRSPRARRQTLWLLLGAVGLVLLIACANVATAMLATGEERRSELALRAALGAGRGGAIVRQLLVESLAIGTAGALAGLLLAAWAVRALLSIDAVGLPRGADVGIDARCLLFAVALGVITPLLFGLLPSLQASRADLRDALAEGGRSGCGAGAIARARLLVAAEVAVALVLLVGAGLLIRSFVNVMSVDPGFDTGGAITASMSVPATQVSRRAAHRRCFYSGLIERLRQLPGVAAAGAVTQAPLSGADHNGAFDRSKGRRAPPTRKTVRTPAIASRRRAISRRCGIPLLQGRTLNEAIAPGALPVAVVNQSFVRQFLAAATNPIGVRFKFSGMDRVNPTFTIVGVVGDVHHRSLVRGRRARGVHLGLPAAVPRALHDVRRRPPGRPLAAGDARRPPFATRCASWTPTCRSSCPRSTRSSAPRSRSAASC